MRFKKQIIYILILFVSVSMAQARVIFVQGDSALTQLSHPLHDSVRNIQQLNKLILNPGDTVLFNDKTTHLGPLVISEKTSGSAENPIVFKSSNPNKKATILFNQRGAGIVISGASHIRIEGLHILGPGGDENDSAISGNGILLNSLRAQGHMPSHIHLRDLEISGFRTGAYQGTEISKAGNGILVSAEKDAPGFQNLNFENIKASDNSWSGIQVTSENYMNKSLRHRGIRIHHSEVFRNKGVPKRSHHSGNGIVVSSSSYVEIFKNLSYENGELNDSNGGPIGIWAWDADRVRIHDNISHSNRTRSESDGGGFDFDGGVENGVIEYNLSFNNDGAGYLLCTFPGSDPVNKVVVRNNVSLNDGQKNGYGGLTAYGTILNSSFIGNIVLTRETSEMEIPSSGYTEKGEVRSGVISLSGNIFAAQGNTHFVSENSQPQIPRLSKFSKNIFVGSPTDVAEKFSYLPRGEQIKKGSIVLPVLDRQSNPRDIYHLIRQRFLELP